jgi:hypothetical protein
MNPSPARTIVKERTILLAGEESKRERGIKGVSTNSKRNITILYIG